MKLPSDWAEVLGETRKSREYASLQQFVAAEREKATVFPPEAEVFTAFHLTPFAKVRVLLLGQDPYHGPGQAHGLSFSVKPGVPTPPSLKNMFKELATDVGVKAPGHGNLEGWARQGMLLLNAVLTVRQGEPNSHAGKGWEGFTDAVIRSLDARPEPVVFVLWGGYARKKAKLLRSPHHRLIEGTHPSPLSASAGFFGSKPYSSINTALTELGYAPMDWRLS